MSRKLEKLFDRGQQKDEDLPLATLPSSPDLVQESTDKLEEANFTPRPSILQNDPRFTVNSQLKHSSVRSDTSNLILFDQGNNQDNLANYLTTRSVDTLGSTSPRMTPVMKDEIIKHKIYLNTWSGVYVPCIHACIGITVFLRLPWIVAWSGVSMTLIYLLISQVLLILTCTSVAAIASNGFKSIGGPYYMISRSLGKEIGVSVGIILWLSLCVSSTIYISGAAIIFSKLVPTISFEDIAWNTHVYGSILLLLITSSQFLNKQKLYILNMGSFIFVIFALLFLFVGFGTASRYPEQVVKDNINNNMDPHYSEFSSDLFTTGPFFYFFTVFFPSTSNIIPGLNRSGSLENPADSLKHGLFTSIITITLLYSVIIVLLGSSINPVFARDQTNTIIAKIAWPIDSVILIFILFIALGASVYCFSGANSILFSVANDDVLPVLHKLKKSYWRVILITVITTLVILQIGNFDSLSKATSLANLLTFCFLNWSTALLGFLNAPGWRPIFKYYHWSLSFIGGLMSLFLMFSFDWRIALGALVCMGILISYVQYYGAVVDWGDGLFALNLQVAQRNLVKLEKYETPNVKNWKPQILGFCPINNEDNAVILSFLSQIKKGRGLSIVLSVIITEDLNAIYASKENEKMQELLRQQMNEYNISGFAEVLVSRSLVDGIAHAVQLAGLGKLSPNTVVMGYITTRDSLDKCEQYVEAIKAVLICKKGLILIKSVGQFPSTDQVQSGTIDVYWIRHDGGMLSILPHLLRKSLVWRKCKLRIFALAELTDNSVEIGKHLKEALLELRIDAYSEVIEIGDSDVSEFTYEKTMQLQERQEYLKKIKHDMRGQRKNSLHLFIRDDDSTMISPYLKQRKM